MNMTSSYYFFFLLVMSFFHFSLSTQSFNHVLCKDVERRALLQFKHDLIDCANKLASWVGEEKECCSWAGIVCDNFTGHVHQIRLRGVDGHCDEEALKQLLLGGDLNPSLLQLQELMHLDLSCNDFGGIQVPSFMGSLKNLRYLNLSSSNFGGIIPPQLGNLSKLEVLDLRKSYYDAFDMERTRNIQWLSSLRSLHYLDMSGMNLSKTIDWFQVINTLPSLAELHLSDCQLSHIHPHVSTLNITSLTFLDLSRNYFGYTFVPRWIFSITSLVSLDLSWCGFQGPTPRIDSFHNLTSLKLLHISGNDFMNSSLVLGSNLISLDISYCDISSLVLDSLHNLTSLRSLDLSNNQLTQAIPKSLGNLCNLREIDLSYNNFQNIGLMYLLECFLDCKSPGLESLSMVYSGLSGHLPDQIGQLSKLNHLDLSGNELINGSLPDSLGQLSKLKYLDLSSNLMTGVVTEAHFAKLTGLKYLNGNGNNLILRPQHKNWVPPFQMQYLLLNSWVLGPQFPVWLQSQRGLIELDISNTNISAPMPESFWSSFPNLIHLDMSQNHIQGTVFRLIPATLRTLNLCSNEFTGPLPYLSNGSGPTVLDLSNNFFVGSLHHLLCPYDRKLIEFLNLGNNNLTGVVPECWVKWPSLLFLSLENNNLSGGVPRTLGFSSDLVSLNMGGNKLSGRLPVSLMNLTRLMFLQLGRNELVGSIPTWLGRELSSLISLELRSNNFDGNIPQELCSLTKIQILDLAQNNLSGTIPRCFNNFIVFSEKDSRDGYVLFSREDRLVYVSQSLVIKRRGDTYSTILGPVMMMDLSSNNLVGRIPSELTTLAELKLLNLSRNQLTGRIPRKIGDMKSLESLDLSLNKLFGELPMSLSNLGFLSNFNISDNNFTGRIPSSTRLQAFGESSFFGNNLCGDPLIKPCDAVPYRDQEENDGSDWGLIISMVLGFVAGFGMIVGPLMVSRSWRIAYFGFLMRVWYMAYDVVQRYFCNMFPK